MTLLLAAQLVGCGARSGLALPEGEETETPEDASRDLSERDPRPGPARIECPDPIFVRAREATEPIDLIWVIDSSGSMRDDLERMRDNVTTFWEAMDRSEADFRVVFITPRSEVPRPPTSVFPRYRAVDYHVTSWEPLLALNDLFPYYDDFVRPDAQTHFIAVTDDDSLAMEAVDFITEMEARLGHDFTFHAVASERVRPTITNPDGVCFTSSSAAARVGRRYYELAEMTGGLQLSICQEDWSILYELLTERIAVPIPIPCAFTVDDDVELDPASLRVRHTDGSGDTRLLDLTEGGDCDGFFFVAERRQVQLCDRTCAEINLSRGRIDLQVGCEE